jgi:hypothetical protein
MLSGRVVDEACFTATSAGGGGACPNGQATQLGTGAAAPCAVVGCEHGTHVASIAAGRLVDGRRGVASDAAILAVQVFTPTAGGPTTAISEVLAAFEWVFQQRGRFAIAAINLSVASATPLATPCADDAVEQAVQRLAAVGIAVVVAAGNSGSPTALAYPACVPGVVSVSSVGAGGAASPFANRADALSLFAPGDTVLAAVPGGGTQIKSGTSQAAPHVTGALAVFRQRQPQASIATLLSHFDRTADTVVGSDGRRAAAGMLRIDRALDPRYGAPSVTPSRAAPPIVTVQSMLVRPGRVEITGTLVDPASVVPATVIVFIDGLVAASVPAAPDEGDRQRFTVSAPLVGGATRQLCLDVLGARAVAATRVACAPVTAPDGSPIGSLDVVDAGFGSVVVRGWALDPTLTSPVDVHLYVDGALIAGTRADGARDDVGAAVPGYGAAHGFSTTVAIASGARQLCAYAIDADDDQNVLIACRSLTPRTGAPFGSLDVAVSAGGTITVAGWAIDPDTRAPIEVHVYVDDRLARGAIADRARRDVDGVFPLYAPDHGYELSIPAVAGRRTVCAYGINVGVGTNALLGCRTT